MFLMRYSPRPILLLLSFYPLTQHLVPDTELCAIARKKNIPILKPENLSEEGFISTIHTLSPDCVLAATFDRRIPARVRACGGRGAYNIHPSLLPAYRGPCPEFWVLRNGEKETGVSIHVMEEAFDAGAIIMQKKVPLSASDTVGVLVYRLAETARDMVIPFLDALEEGTLPPLSQQDTECVTDAPLIDTATLHINWEDSAVSIYNLIRAANPVGGAWTVFQGFSMKIWHAAVLADDEALRWGKAETPGTFAGDTRTQRLYAATGEGVLGINVVQPALFFYMDGWSFAERMGL
ncbi:MAG: methionyl-tRNA formyltransferase [Clostridia bacterium]|nr:methionyl-tRNA formyltransferase [Clostridia bacterium]